MKNENEYWMTVRSSIALDYKLSEGWVKAIHIFKQRIESKFLLPIDALLKLRQDKGEGFAIVSVQCAVIECFAAFRWGRIYNFKMSEKKSPSYEYKDSKALFVKFLHNATIFNNIFYSVDQLGASHFDQPFSAADFYANVRCGLLHEARTKGIWTINAEQLNQKNQQLIEYTGGRNKIYRRVLQGKLKEYLSSYCSELCDPDQTELRRFFARKLDDLNDIPPDSKIDWWIDK